MKDSACLKVGLGKLTKPSASRREDARQLVAQFLDGLDLEEFPPKLLLLWVTKSFQPFDELLEAIQEALAEKGLGDVPLIGASVAACMFDQHVHEEGAVLICLASPFLNVRAGAIDEVAANSEEAAEQLLIRLGITPQGRCEFENSFLWTFLPGGSVARSASGQVVEELSRKTKHRLKMFGGGATLGRDRTAVGYQFFNCTVHSGAIVAAHVDSELYFGLGICDGLVPTSQALHPIVSDAEPRRITAFQEGTVESVLEGEGQLCAFKLDTGEVLLPPSTGQPLLAPRDLGKHATVSLVRPDFMQILDSVKRLEEYLVGEYRVAPKKLGVILAISSVLRYDHRDSLGFDPNRALRKAHQRHNGAEFVGAYMDGELGIDWNGRPRFTHWSLTELIFTDQLTDAYQSHIASLAMIQTSRSKAMHSADSAIGAALDTLGRAGHRRAMLSLVFNDGDDKWIVAHSATGEKWKSIVLPETRRKYGEGDILTIVTLSGNAEFVANASEDERCLCRSEGLAHRAGVISFYAVPILDERGDVIGVLQIDLGDMSTERELPLQLKARLDSLGTMVSFLVNQAIRTEELRFVRCLDKIQDECLGFDSVERAFGHFVNKAAQELKVDAHVRLRNGDGEFHLIDGIGKYFEACRTQRSVIAFNDSERMFSSALNAVEREQAVVVNEAAKDDRHQRKLEKYQGTPLGDALIEIGSYAGFPICKPGQLPIGTVSFISPSPWFFTQAKLRSWSDIGHRLSFLAEHIRQREDKNRSLRQLRFIREITPPLEYHQNSYDALRAQAAKIAAAANAQAVSCYLWDQFRSRFVLRAQDGWRTSKWLDAAWYETHEGLTGTFALSTVPAYISDALSLKTLSLNRQGKYQDEIFDPPLSPDETYELIALPLNFKDRPLGIVTLHRRRKLPIDGESGFATVDEALLKEATDIMSAFAAALSEHDLVRWKADELERRHKVLAILNDAGSSSIHARLGAFCKAVVAEYSFRHCTVYVQSQAGGLEVWGQATRNGKLVRKGTESAARQVVSSGKPEPTRSPLTADQQNPSAVRRENIVEGVALPIKIGSSVIGALDLGWKGVRRPSQAGILPHHDERGLQELADRLGSTILTDELQRNAKLAQAALDGIAVHLRGNFHWLAQSLASVKLDIEKLSSKNADPEQRELIEHAKETVVEQREFIRRVRFASERIVESRRELHAIDTLLQEAINKNLDGIEANHIDLQMLEIEHFDAFVDGLQIRESFENIISNAVNAMPKGGVLKLTLRQLNDSHSWQFEAVDNGIGFSLSDYDGWDEKDDGKIHGGVGLLLTRLYCESHNGRFEITPGQSGAGTKVSVSIPLTETGRKLVKIDLPR